MFSEGVDLGFDVQKQTRMSHAKKSEIMGSEWTELGSTKTVRSDWNRSTIVLMHGWYFNIKWNKIEMRSKTIMARCPLLS
jgi:uncharacterized protein YjbK